MNTRSRVPTGVVLSIGHSNNLNHNETLQGRSRGMAVKTRIRAGFTPKI
jgi:hypothetical protein